MSQTPCDSRMFTGNSDGVQSLQQPRRPKQETEDRLLHGQPAGSHFGGMYKTQSLTSLRVTAPEFVPRTVQYSNVANSMPAYLAASQPVPLSAGAAEFIPRTDIPPPMMPNFGSQPQMPPPPLGDFINNFNQMNLGPGGGGGGGPERDEDLLYEFSSTIMMLTTIPGNYMEYLKPLCDKLHLCQSQEAFSRILDSLYMQCVYEPNFRYTGAKVLNFLCGELKNHPIFGEFKSRFLNRCQEDYNKRDHLIKSGEPDGLLKVCGLALFMGELFLNVAVEGSGKSEPLEFLPGALASLLLTLALNPTDNSIKTACQLLKLAGGQTEDALKDEQSRKNFTTVFHYMETLKTSTLISKNIQMLIQSVLTQRQNNWGRLEPTQASSDAYYPDASTRVTEFSQSEPVFYKGGKPVTREEAGFVEEEEEEDDNYDVFVLTEEEERDFLQWQEESQYENQLIGGPPVSTVPLVSQHGYGDAPVYQAWSTNDSSAYGGYHNYEQTYDYAYPPYQDEEGLQMDDEAEQAYEEFLSSQRR